ncbi:MAG TPA: hypothetical protein VK815_04585, partial [Candidatus Acidoferrales bacterium]|nr:hypothetical protein [Candidatus Acidoferrales bacterium]
MNPVRKIKTLLVRYGIGAALAVTLGVIMLESVSLRPKLVDPSYNVPFLGRPVQPQNDVEMILIDEKSHNELKQPFNRSWDR